ncbi:MAG TPA: Ni/Fe hydrogenase subunit alpha [Acidimicrobiales bacterium]|nr:Ni/Fe hydrogenase subunit alpha [Acidimicrobiales bacterium]
MTHRGSPDRTLHVRSLARVEGEGAMHVEVRDGHVTDVQLQIYEPPRFFEAFLRGRAFSEPPDITARICGICPVAYQMSACAAIEDACGVTVDEGIAALRRLLYCGEWIESHALHVYLLHAPDFLGFDGAVGLAREHREVVERGLQLKKVGNRIMETVGGRAVHPVNVKVGGFYRTPSRQDLARLAEPLRWALDAAMATVAWVAGFDFPDFELDHELVALDQPGLYPIDAGARVVSTGGLDFGVADFEQQVIEEQVAHSNALHARLRDGRRYLVGPLARYSLNSRHLSPAAAQAAAAAGLGPVCRNPFRSIVVRSVEIVYACEEALRIIDGYEPPARPAADLTPRAATGYGCTEAPRGLLYHRYDLSADGLILAARIVPPTSQNQAAIEDDLRRFADDRFDLPTAELTAACEQAIRNYDPCISCATHFLDLHVRHS